VVRTTHFFEEEGGWVGQGDASDIISMLLWCERQQTDLDIVLMPVSDGIDAL